MDGGSFNSEPLPSELYPHLKVPAESLTPGKRYLLYLYQPASWDGQKKVTAEYELDPNLTYYRAFEGARGAREIPAHDRPNSQFDFVTPAASAIESFCKAVDTPDVMTKIARLKTLQLTVEPYWRDSVVRAIQALDGGGKN